MASMGDVQIVDAATPFLKKLAAAMPAEFDRALKSTGWWLRKEIQTGMDAGSPGGQDYKPFSGIKTSGSKKYKTGRHEGRMVVFGAYNRKAGKPLGKLRSAVRYDYYADSRRVLIGWLSQSAAKLGELHEAGGQVDVTPKMRRFMWANAVPMAASTTKIAIPRRPTIGPEYAQHQAAVPDYIEAKMWKNIQKVEG